MLSSILQYRGRKSEKKEKKQAKRKRKETAKLRESSQGQGWLMRRTKSLRKVSAPPERIINHISPSIEERDVAYNKKNHNNQHNKKKRPRWHCSHCNRFNSSAKSSCSKCSLPRRPKSFMIVSSSGSSIIVEDVLAPTTPVTTSIETPRSSALPSLSALSCSSPASSCSPRRGLSTVTMNPSDSNPPKLIPTKSASLNFIPDLEQSNSIIRTPVRQLLEERKAKLERRKHRQALKQKEKDSPNPNINSLSPSMGQVPGKKKKSSSRTNKGKRAKKSTTKKERKKNAITQQKVMREALPWISTGSSVYPKDAEHMCPFMRFPYDMMLRIFTFLPGKCLGNISLACKCWYEVCKEPWLWKQSCLKELYVASEEEWIHPPPWKDDWKEYYKHFIRKWEMDVPNLEITNYCTTSAVDNYQVHEGLYLGMKITIRAIRSVADIEEFRFTKELQDINTLHTNYIADVIGTCKIEGTLCVLMPFYERGNLMDILMDEGEPISWALVLDMCESMVRGVRDLHAFGIVHKNLSPSSFLVDKEMNVYLSDYVNLMNPQSNMKIHKERNYYAMCAPEIYMNDAPFSTQTDVFSLGMVFWYLVQRCITCHYEEPYAEYKEIKFGFQAMIMCATRDLRPTLSAFCHPFLATLIQKCWDKDPRVRPTVNELLQAIESLKEEYEEKTAEWESKYTINISSSSSPSPSVPRRCEESPTDSPADSGI